MISKTCGYAIRAIVLLNEHPGEKLGVVQIAEQLGIPQHFLSKVLKDLAKHQLISSVKGPHGGYFSNQTTPNASLIDIIHVIDGLGVLNKCFLGKDRCSQTNPCPLHNEFEKSRQYLFEVFRNRTISQLNLSDAHNLI
ncbi:RrF2 family transcriptional regulator [Jiulongibacter sediminis]|uniref:Rrf2 family transcriptional regulator n=1 Tax=Jiulongibacter sediminis TaxID=1605367 RepID=A0A0N8H999_9BACT|nr:Rrf2 family transcriptional regulator [Jiulongibacter sediminis]KPM46780.1 hypothetical protein AFM12_18685 [Jiulongibacter sediminis]TBX21684.1 hypothetical protein TK44_18690 [Jiulongibacter sediminis]